MANNIFSAKSQNKSHILIVGFLSMALMALDLFFPRFFNAIQSVAEFSFEPLFALSAIPSQTVDFVDDHSNSKAQMIRELQTLKSEKVITEMKLQQFAYLTAENAQLKEWLKLNRLTANNIRIASVIGDSDNRASKTLILNQGEKQGVYVGQMAVDPYGLMGQIISVYPLTSRLLLLSDPSHSVSVRNARTGSTSILSGHGDSMLLDLDYVPTTEDVQKGDMLYTSGLGGRFQAGYPAGIVVDVKKHGKSEFCEVVVKPIASLQGAEYVGLLTRKALETPQVIDTLNRQVAQSPNMKIATQYISKTAVPVAVSNSLPNVSASTIGSALPVSGQPNSAVSAPVAVLSTSTSTSTPLASATPTSSAISPSTTPAPHTTSGVTR